jgi:hypothetical protein
MKTAARQKNRELARPSVLTIAKVQPGRYRIALDRSDESRMKPIQTACDVVAPAQVIDHFLESIERLIAESNATGDPPDKRALSEAGRGLLDTVLPRGNPGALAVREELSALRGGLPLLIATDDPRVPWELINEEGGDDFLGLKFDIGRRLVSGVGGAVARHQSISRPTALVVANPTEDLPETEIEARAVVQFLERRGVRCSFLEGKEATFPVFLDQIRKGHKLIHFAGHIRYDDIAREYALVLHDGKVFTASAVRSHLRSRPVVFLNGCESGVVVKGLTEAFLAGGARAVVGALYRIPDGGAQMFAKAFYDAALSGRCGIGCAVRQARLAVKGKTGLGATWASFALYGDPTLRVSFWEDEVERIQGSLAPEQASSDPAIKSVEVMVVGPLRKAECTPEAWEELWQALRFATRPSGTLVTSFDLFRGFLADSQGPISLSLGRLGLSASQIDAPNEQMAPTLDGGPVPCTSNTSKILLMAQASASTAGRLIDRDDLLRAFVTHGGGQTGASLRRRGIVPACLTSRLFRDGGVLDYSRFDLSGTSALEIAEEFAGQTHYDVLHRVHLLYGLLRVPEGTFGGAIRSVGISSEALAELLYVELPRGNATTQHDRPLRISSLSAELLEILCNAEVLAGAEQGSDQINTEHLAKAWGRSGGGLGGSFLVRNGVKVTKLFE